MERSKIGPWLQLESRNRRSLSEMESKQIVEAYGIPTNKAKLAMTENEAVTFAQSIGYPVALKVDSDEIVHKSEAGGVELHLENEDEVRIAFRRMTENLEKKAQGKAYNGIAVHEMCQAPFELIIGAKRDPIFGPIILVGMGGIYAELLKDVSVRLAPVQHGEAKEMIEELQMGAILKGYRGKPLADLEAVEKIILSLSNLMIEQPEIVELDLNPVLVGYQGDGAFAVDASMIIEPAIEHVHKTIGDRSAFKKLLNPQSVAIVGASNTKKKVGGRLLDTLVQNQYLGTIYPISKSGDKVQNLEAYDRIEALNKPVDVVSLVIPPQAVIENIHACFKLGIKNIVIHSSGFSEAGEEGKEIQEKIVQLALAHQLNIIGPNSQGIIDFNKQYYLSFSSVVNSPKVKKGNVCLISQSGAIASAILTRGWELGVGFSHFISTGNEACVGIPDFIDAVADDPNVKVIAVFLEGISSWETFQRAVKKARSNGKAVVVYKSGNSEVGKKVISSHTGSLAGEDTVYDAAFEKIGVLRVKEITALLDSCLALSWTKTLPKQARIGIISTSGGACSILADESELKGIQVPEFSEETIVQLERYIPSYGSAQNPVDMTAQVLATTEPFLNILQAVSKDDHIDYVVLMLTTNAEPGALEMARHVIDLYPKLEKPFFICRMGTDDLAPNAVKLYREHQIAIYPSPERLISSIHYLTKHQQLQVTEQFV